MKMHHLGVSLLLLGLQVVVALRPLPFNETRIFHLQQSVPAFKKFQQLAADTPGTSQLAYIPGVGYAASVEIGSNLQQFYLQLDLWNSRTWVTGTDCLSKCEDYCNIAAICQISCRKGCCTPPSKNPNYGCDGKSHFDVTQSNTFKSARPGANWISANGEQSTVTGVYGNDNFAFGDIAVQASNVEFGLANELSLTYTQWSADGVLGLAKDKSTDAKDSKPVLSGLPTKLFQLYLQQCDSLTYCGSISVGSEGLNTLKICDAAEKVSFTSKYNDWTFEVTHIEIVKPPKRMDKTYQVELDFNNQMTKIFTDVLKVVTDAAQAKFNSHLELYTVDCNLQFTLKLGVNEAHYLIIDQSMIVGQLADETGKKTCYLKVEEMNHHYDKSASHFVLGANVLTNYCQTYNLQDGTVSFYALGPQA